MELKKGDKIKYLGNMPYKLANGQEVEKEGEEMFIRNNVFVQPEFFSLVKEKNAQEQELSELSKKDLNKKDDKKLKKGAK